jgi:hypothetical protein
MTTNSRFCSVCAREAGLDPDGYGGAAYDTIIAAELPLEVIHTSGQEETHPYPQYAIAWLRDA